MIDNSVREKILALMAREVVPAVGCTEPMAVALCVARATEILGREPERITLFLSANILKNAMGVGIPGTGMIGLPIAVALGALIGKSEYQLEVLKDLTPATLERGKQYFAGDHINIQLKQGECDKLYIESICETTGNHATAIIEGGHTAIVFEERNGEVITDRRTRRGDEAEDEAVKLNMKLVYEFALTAPIDELQFILKTRDLNMRAAEESIKGNYGHCLGKTMDRPLSHGIFGNTMFSHIISKTALACDARMGGAMIPVMSNSGSGNQGICATNPVAVFAQENENTEEELIRALTLSHLTAIYIKQSLWYHLPHGRQLRRPLPCRQEHDSQPYGHDMRRRQAQLLTQDMFGRIDSPALSPAGARGQVCDQRRGHHRLRRRPLHTQPYQHRQGGDVCHRRHGAPHHDRQVVSPPRGRHRSRPRYPNIYYC